DERICRPANFPAGAPGRDHALATTKDGTTVAALPILGRTYMRPVECPYQAAERVLQSLAGKAQCVVVDMHAEATADKYLIGHYLKGRVAAVLGTHTHVPTADQQILPGGTAFVSDIGMCGDYDSVIGMQKAPSVRRFVTKMPGEKPKPAEGEATLCGVFVGVDDSTGLARRIEPVRVGGRLQRYVPRP